MRGKDCNDMAQYKESWRAFVNAVMNLRVAYNLVISLLAEKLLASVEGLSAWS